MTEICNQAAEQLFEDIRQGRLSRAEFKQRLLQLDTLSGAGATAEPGLRRTEPKIRRQSAHPAIAPGPNRSALLPPANHTPDAPIMRYLDHVIASHHALQLQGIRANGKPAWVALDKIYIPLHTIDESGTAIDPPWLARVVERLSDGPINSDKRRRGCLGKKNEPGELTVAAALARHSRLVLVGNPGCGKTFLLRYLALTYAQGARNGPANNTPVKERLQLNEKRLPILLSLRDFAFFLRHPHPHKRFNGPILLLDYLHQLFARKGIALPRDFFTKGLKKGTFALLLDDLDKVADPATRYRIARIIDRFTRCYPQNRYVVTSRGIGYSGSTRLGADYSVARVCDFKHSQVEQFIVRWNHAVAIALAGKDTEEMNLAIRCRSRALLMDIQNSVRLSELATNPLHLSLIALIQLYRPQMPERRTELFDAALDIILGRYCEDKRPNYRHTQLDICTCRAQLSLAALKRLEKCQNNCKIIYLYNYLKAGFFHISDKDHPDQQNLEILQNGINPESGLPGAWGQGPFEDNQPNFQEYLAARAIADRNDYIAYTLTHMSGGCWREVVLLQTGYLSTQGKQRASALIRAIMHHKKEPELFYNLVLAADCLQEVGRTGVTETLWQEVMERLRKAIDAPLRQLSCKEKLCCTIRDRRRPATRDMIYPRTLAAGALAGLKRRNPGTQEQLWQKPFGEPCWLKVPSGEFCMGPNGQAHTLVMDDFWIAISPTTQAQYHLFVQDTGHRVPEHWIGDCPAKGLESHPVHTVSWYDAIAYCNWLSKKVGRSITLPSEAQWEKAARGGDGRTYPWGDQWHPARANTREMGLGKTTPVTIFPDGAAYYGCLEMVGNVFEWTRSLWGRDGEKPDFTYPYDPNDGREAMDADADYQRVVRGGAYGCDRHSANCTTRDAFKPDNRQTTIGFRVSLSLSAQDY